MPSHLFIEGFIPHSIIHATADKTTNEKLYISHNLEFYDTLELNTIIWIQSLPKDEQGPSTRIKDDLSALINISKYKFIEKNVVTKDALLALLNDIAKHAILGCHPVLHFDMHGSKNDGLLLAPSGEHVSWAELANSMREINIATHNNLCCIFATCHALNFVRSTEICKATPFYLIIAPPKEVCIGFLEDQTNSFYKSLIDKENITTAHKENLSKHMSLLGCQRILFIALNHYIKSHTRGKGAKDRRERLLTQHLDTTCVSNPTKNQLAEKRKLIKAFIKPNQNQIDSIASTFLIGRPAGFTLEDIEAFMGADISFGNH